MTDFAFTGRKVWRVTGKVKKAEEPTYYKADHRVIWVAAKDFDEAVKLAKDAMTTTWSETPHDAQITEITPVRLGGQPEQDTIYIPVSTLDRRDAAAPLAERFMDIEGAVRRIQALLGEDDAVTTDQAAEIAALTTILEHLVKGDPGCNEDTPADVLVREIRA